ncbi:MAG: CRISPR-associated helicase Cas3' [Alphaproteobacteria bacterium]|nr:CRISPR-associated helicase Cas3' [Alphaproteobacteria bacterium]
MDYLSFWGKTRSADTDGGPAWHPLAFHSLDAAAAGEALLVAHRSLTDRFCDLFGLPGPETVALLRFLICLHDIGKFAVRFQAKAPERFPSCFGVDASALSSRFDHGLGGLRLFMEYRDILGTPDRRQARHWLPIVSAVAGHHGSPPDSTATGGTLRADFGPAGIEASCAFARRVRVLLNPPDPLPVLDDNRARRISWLLAGLAVLSDWIGSNKDWFPFRSPNDFPDIESYWTYAREQAVAAVQEAGIVPAAATGRLGYDALIGPQVTPSPMQEWARDVLLPDGPALFIVEDETGSGKTEAALMLAHRLMASGRADGFYIALPTMATANAMFDRLGRAVRQLFKPDASPSLALAHGARGLHQGFRAARANWGRTEAPYGNVDEADIAASTACAEWIADDRRRTFLADAGAGTVDQALLAVLPARHQSLRLLGLAQRVPIIDEVHAYDAYMRREIETLLTFQAALGGSAVLLSATLPAGHRQSLADAFAKGLGEEPVRIAEQDYPLATVRARGAQIETPVPGRPGRGRKLPVLFLRSPDEALAEVEQAARAGRAALYIRNTVDDAREAHAALASRGIRAELFHARFALADRLEIEQRTVETFGKESVADERAGKVLVATQVVEQSLDLDFDVLASDLAPMDLLIQRAGRLWRHGWRRRAGGPELLVVAPPAMDDPPEDWFETFLPRAAYVYRDHARLWLTVQALEQTEAIESPKGLRGLIEAVYGPEAESNVPCGLIDKLLTFEGKESAARSMGHLNTLSASSGYMRDAGVWDSDMRVPTRLVEDSRVTLRLARMHDDRIEPYALKHAPDEPWRAWRLSEVDMSQRHVKGEAPVPSQLVDAVREARANWGRYDEDKILVLLEDAGDGRLAGAVMGPDGECAISYTDETGLVVKSR